MQHNDQLQSSFLFKVTADGGEEIISAGHKGVLLSCRIEIGFDIFHETLSARQIRIRTHPPPWLKGGNMKRLALSFFLLLLFWTIRCHRLLSALKKEDEIKPDFEQREKAGRAGFVRTAGPR